MASLKFNALYDQIFGDEKLRSCHGDAEHDALHELSKTFLKDTEMAVTSSTTSASYAERHMSPAGESTDTFDSQLRREIDLTAAINRGETQSKQTKCQVTPRDYDHNSYSHLNKNNNQPNAPLSLEVAHYNTPEIVPIYKIANKNENPQTHDLKETFLACLSEPRKELCMLEVSPQSSYTSLLNNEDVLSRKCSESEDDVDDFASVLENAPRSSCFACDESEEMHDSFSDNFDDVRNQHESFDEEDIGATYDCALYVKLLKQARETMNEIKSRKLEPRCQIYHPMSMDTNLKYVVRQSVQKTIPMFAGRSSAPKVFLFMCDGMMDELPLDRDSDDLHYPCDPFKGIEFVEEGLQCSTQMDTCVDDKKETRIHSDSHVETTANDVFTDCEESLKGEECEIFKLYVKDQNSLDFKSYITEDAEDQMTEIPAETHVTEYISADEEVEESVMSLSDAGSVFEDVEQDSGLSTEHSIETIQSDGSLDDDIVKGHISTAPVKQRDLCNVTSKGPMSMDTALKCSVDQSLMRVLPMFTGSRRNLSVWMHMAGEFMDEEPLGREIDDDDDNYLETPELEEQMGKQIFVKNDITDEEAISEFSEEVTETQRTLISNSDGEYLQQDVDEANMENTYDSFDNSEVSFSGSSESLPEVVQPAASPEEGEGIYEKNLPITPIYETEEDESDEYDSAIESEKSDILETKDDIEVELQSSSPDVDSISPFPNNTKLKIQLFEALCIEIMSSSPTKNKVLEIGDDDFSCDDKASTKDRVELFETLCRKIMCSSPIKNEVLEIGDVDFSCDDKASTKDRVELFEGITRRCLDASSAPKPETVVKKMSQSKFTIYDQILS